jgi:hypothetical protein
MTQPRWLEYGVAVSMVMVSVYCLCRLYAARRWNRRNATDVNMFHVLMGPAMAGMLVPRWNLLPTSIWATAFVIMGAWFLFRSVGVAALYRGSSGALPFARGFTHYPIHLIMAIGMLFMYRVGMQSTDHGRGMSMSGTAVSTNSGIVSALILVVLLISATWQLDAIGNLTAAKLNAKTSAVAAPAGRWLVDNPVEITTGQTMTSVTSMRWLAPRLEMVCHISMCLAMGYMLVLML